MTLRHAFLRLTVCGLLSFAVSGTAFAADRKTTNTLLGAGLGAAAGAVLSEGDPMLTLGGAAAGGLLGNILTEDRKHHDRSYRRHYKGPKHQYVSKQYGHGYKKQHKKYRKHNRRHR